MHIKSTMTFFVAAFTTTTRVAGRQSRSKFIQNSGKLFSSTTMSSTDEHISDSPLTKYFTVGLTGSDGLIGKSFRDEVRRIGTINDKPIRCVALKRGNYAEKKKLEDTTFTSLTWNPHGRDADDVMDPSVLNEMDAIIHLSGENISTGSSPLNPMGIRPWTDAKKKEILDSRVITTSALAKSIAAGKKGLSFLVAGGVGAYGSKFIGKGVTPADESTDISNSDGFLAEVSRQWEAASQEAKESGARVVNLRNGVVLSKKGGAMAKLYPIFLMGGGGIVGPGDQYFPYISARDMARAMIHVLQTPALEGPVNMCAPGGCTNEEFTKAMGKVLNRPTILPFPSFAVSLLFGEMGEEILLGGSRAEPSKLLESGFEFSHSTIEEAVQSAVDETI